MSIRPVDMQIVVQKTQEIHSAKQTVISKLDNELAQAQTRNKEEIVLKTHTVNNTERSDLRRVKSEDEEDREKRKKRSKGKSDREKNDVDGDEKTQELNKKVSVLGTHFDMKV
ncbi:hypothetical protein QE109_00510 [Fusibacter bizertensis]|uniref:Uncharacterized protein n=1 Tax=Fusibacter bizertensis TaxID=1488331 RepID=A0ABT6N857_9FIRM|nr:hypothetical protein [Fusibacter bizertensis]MDH8676601.1 hypothetical protein [Fusibacter bizertensis]